MSEPAVNLEELYPPRAVITQVGRWRYSIHISHGLMSLQNEFGGPHRWGYKRAEKYAERSLVKYLRDEARRKNVWEIGP